MPDSWSNKTPQAYGLNNPGSQRLAALDTEAKFSLLIQQRRARVFESWMRGSSVEDISTAEQVSESTILRCIASQRARLSELYDGSMKELVAERIANLVNVKAEAYKYMQFMPGKAAQLLMVVLRSEETIAKIQGVLNEKHLLLGKIQHEVKLYDFEDKTPPPMGIIEGTGSIVDNPVMAVISEEPLIQREIIIPDNSDSKDPPATRMVFDF